MRRSFLYSGFRKTGPAVLLLGAVFLFACTNAADRDSAALRKDQESIAQLSRIKSFIDMTKTIPPQDFAVVKQILEKYPAAAESRLVYREALVARKDWETLESFLVKTPIGEMSPEDRRTLGSVQIRNGRYEAAVSTLAPMTEANASDIEAQSQLALAEFHLGRLDSAAARLDTLRERLAAEKRGNDLALRGLIYLAKGEFAKAEEVLKAALAIVPESSAITNALSQVYARSGNAAEAERFRLRTLEINDRFAADQLRAYRVVEQINDLESAWKSKNYNEVIRLANAMLGSADRTRKPVLLQYIVESHKALGNTAEAQKAVAELQNLQKQQ